MSNAVANISAALGYDAVESMLASGRPLSDCYRFAAMAAEMLDSSDECPASAPTMLASTSDTVRPGTR